MLGDAHDLAEIVCWVKKRFWDDNKDEQGELLEWPYPQAVRIEVADSLVDLCRAFDNTETAHRKAYNMTGNKGAIKVSSLAQPSGVGVV